MNQSDLEVQEVSEHANISNETLGIERLNLKKAPPLLDRSSPLTTPTTSTTGVKRRPSSSRRAASLGSHQPAAAAAGKDALSRRNQRIRSAVSSNFNPQPSTLSAPPLTTLRHTRSWSDRKFEPESCNKSVRQRRSVVSARTGDCDRLSGSIAFSIHKRVSTQRGDQRQELTSTPVSSKPRIRHVDASHELARNQPGRSRLVETSRDRLSKELSTSTSSPPTPSLDYLQAAAVTSKLLTTPQHLLLVLDLNGTLLYRRVGSTAYKPRPSLTPFLDYCISNHSVLVWSSASPRNVSSICNRIFTPKQRQRLLGIWARDTLGLSSGQYTKKVQVYKRLDRIWDDHNLQTFRSQRGQVSRWDQSNTLLIDDSALKASAQPFNAVALPQFVGPGVKPEEGIDVLGRVVAYVEMARRWDNVSSYVKRTPFAMSTSRQWDWTSAKILDAGEMESDDESGGVELANVGL
ncbi:MAG: hypothetical protein Q9190_004092 [Brigantiaea leucoxantha]